MINDQMEINLQLAIEHGLTEDEYNLIIKKLGRTPNYIELGIFSVMWSEHCSYKSSRVHLKKFQVESKHVLEGPGENAGIIDIGDGLVLGMKIESHNHPSAIDPYEGAATGVGGILRDIFTMGLRPVANLNSLRFGNLDNPKSRYLFKHVVEGIAGYGNCTGIPTIAGEVYFDDCYQTNCLVNAMAVGIGKRDKIVKGIASGEGNPVIYIGSKTGRDGIHGATFASEELSDNSESKRSSVQIADPFTEKLLIEACMELIESGVVVGMQDMGAAGLTSSSVEMSSRGGSGLEIDLDKVPVREGNMSGYEIMLSESQERMLVIVEKGKEKIARDILKKWDLEFSIIGKVIPGDRLKLKFKGNQICDIPVKGVTDDAPKYNREIKKPALEKKDFILVEQLKIDLQDMMLKVISSPTIASKRWVFEQYDYWVGTDTIIRPGKDAAVMRIKGKDQGYALTVDGNSRYCKIDPYLGGILCVIEAAANITASGAVPLAVTDCLNFGNPEIPERFYEFVKVVDGIADSTKFFDTPVISGNVSFYNESEAGSVAPTPVIGMVGIIRDMKNLKPQEIKEGMTCLMLTYGSEAFLAGSQLEKELGKEFKPDIPNISIKKFKSLMESIARIRDEGFIRFITDVSDGGLITAVLESLFNFKFGFEFNINEDKNDDIRYLFGELPGRFLVFEENDKIDDLITTLKKNDEEFSVVGKVVQGRNIKFNDKINYSIDLIKQEFQQRIPELMNITI